MATDDRAPDVLEAAAREMVQYCADDSGLRYGVIDDYGLKGLVAIMRRHGLRGPEATYFCNKCGWVGQFQYHPGCEYSANPIRTAEEGEHDDEAS